HCWLGRQCIKVIRWSETHGKSDIAAKALLELVDTNGTARLASQNDRMKSLVIAILVNRRLDQLLEVILIGTVRHINFVRSIAPASCFNMPDRHAIRSYR